MQSSYTQANPRKDVFYGDLSEKTISIVGLGGGGEIALHLLRSGIEKFHLFDFDTLESGNLIRHVCGSEYVGMNKAEAVASLLRKYPETTPNTIHAHTENIFTAREEFEHIVSNSDLLIVATDTDASRFYAGEVAQEANVPAVFVSMFEQGCGGEVFASIPGQACYGCFTRHQGRKAFIENYVATKNKTDCSSARDTRSMPGLGIDQSFFGAIAARKSLEILLQGQEHSLPSMGTNWIVFSIFGIPRIVENHLSSLCINLPIHSECSCSKN